MFTDPQTVTVNAVAKAMPRVEQKGRQAVYQNSDQTFTLTISHTITEGRSKSGSSPTGQRIRSLVKVEQRAIVANPLDASQQDYDTLVFYCVIERPGYGFSDLQVKQLVAGLKTWLDDTAVGKLFGMES
jgi:hypothetical protein